MGLGWARSHDECHAISSRPAGGRGRRGCLSISDAQRGVYVSTEVYAEHSCVQSSVAEELKDVSAASSITAIIPGCPGDSKAIHSTV